MFGKSIAPYGLAAIILTSLLGCSDGATNKSGGVLDGDFTIVTARRASDVAGGSKDATFSTKRIGTQVSFADTLIWVDGTSCEDWTVKHVRQAPINLEDDVLIDLAIGPEETPHSRGDQRENTHLDIYCGTEVIGSLTKVDDQVLVTPSASGLTYIILERPLDAEQIKAFQFQLKDMKFYDGEKTGEIDRATRIAVSLYAGYRGRFYTRFKRAAITENLLDGLGILDD